MFVHNSAIKSQAIIDVIEGKIMTQQHLMEEAPLYQQIPKTIVEDKLERYSWNLFCGGALE